MISEKILCDKCKCDNAKRYSFHLGYQFDGHRNENYYEYIDLCQTCYNDINYHADQILNKIDIHNITKNEILGIISYIYNNQE